MNSSLSAPLQIEYLDFYGRLHPEETDSFAENGFSGNFDGELAANVTLRAILPRESELSWECHAARFLKHGSKRT